MTDARAFQAGLDAEPGDWQLRLILAGWLEEQRDERAAGYRALGTNRKPPQPYDDRNNSPKGRPVANDSWWDDVGRVDKGSHDLFRGWFRRLNGGTQDGVYRRTFATRRAADAAARAFLKLPPKRRAELLKPPDESAGADSGD